MATRKTVPFIRGAARGFCMPAEWERHRATWMVWPHNRADWDVKMSAVEWSYIEIIRHLVGGERVAVLYQDRATELRSVRRLKQSGVDLEQIDRYRIATNRSWIRDFGPLFVRRQPSKKEAEIAITDWGFNGWARYRAWQLDNLVPRRISRRLGVRRFDAILPKRKGVRSVVLEGGSIDVNGCGLMLSTEECLLGSVQIRNPGLTRVDLERVFFNYLGVEKVLWLNQGIMGDDTHGHVDDVARFVSKDTVVAAIEHDPSDENYKRLKDNFSRLKSMTDQRDRPLRIIRIPMPSPLYFEAKRLPASYLNFYIGNRCVLVPTFNDSRDRGALAAIARVFPERKVIGIHAIDLVLGLGTIHCLTQQEPIVEN
jgi:agmatine deiminase